LSLLAAKQLDAVQLEPPGGGGDGVGPKELPQSTTEQLIQVENVARRAIRTYVAFTVDDACTATRIALGIDG